MDQLPIDVILNIFSRLPIKSLLRFKCVSRLWSNHIDSPQFAEMHLSQGIEKPRILLLGKDGGKFFPSDLKYSLPKLDIINSSKAYYVLVGSCNGVLCFRNKCDDGVVTLFNPLRQEAVLAVLVPPSTNPIPSHYPVPNCKRKYGLGFDGPTSTYKVICVYCDDERGLNLGAQVCSLGTTSSNSTTSWRSTIGNNVPPNFALSGPPVFACGSLHWIARPRTQEFKGKKIATVVSFHIGREEFGLICCPDFDCCDRLQLVGLKGVLGVVCFFERSIEIWAMKDYDEVKKKEWVKEYDIYIRGPMLNTLCEFIGPWENGELLLKYCGQSFVSYDPKTDGLRYIDIPGLDFDTEIYSLTGSVVSLSMFKGA